MKQKEKKARIISGSPDKKAEVVETRMVKCISV